MATNAATKMLTATAASLAHRRPLTCSATRLVPQPPDLIRWVKREGGFVHPNLKIADHASHGLGLLSTEPIANGSDLIALPDHLPLRFDPHDEPESALGRLAARVPGSELSSLKSFAFLFDFKLFIYLEYGYFYHHRVILYQ